jgi:hypothetical protein
MQGLGLVATTRAEVVQALEGNDPKLRAILRLDPPRQALRDRMIEVAVFDRLERNLRPFIRQFGGVAGQPQDAAEATSTVDQALFLTNGEPLRTWLSSQPDRLVGRGAAMADPTTIAEELYLSILSRRPTPEERAEVADYLARRATEGTSALRELAWALLASSEFRFNH